MKGLPSPRSTVTSARARWASAQTSAPHTSDQEQRVEHDARPQDAPRRARQLVARAVADQAARPADPVHDRVARVHALRAVDALHLQPVADVDAGRARRRRRRRSRCSRPRRRRAAGASSGARELAARLAAAGVVADDQRAPVEQHRLEAAVRAGHHADLLAEPAEVEEHQRRWCAAITRKATGCSTGERVHPVARARSTPTK